MKIKINRELFKSAILATSHFSSQKSSAPQLIQSIKLAISKEKITFQSTNLNDYFTTELICKTSEEVEFVVDTREIGEYLNILEAQEVELEIDGSHLTIIEGKNKASFPTLSSKDFPKEPEVSGNPQSLNKQTIKDIEKVLFSVSKEEARPHLTGVNFSIKNNEMFLVTTDGFRLSVVKRKKSFDIPTATISSNALFELVRLFNIDNNIKVIFDENNHNASFKTVDTSLTTRLIEGEFPPFEKVIPESQKINIVFSREEALRALKLTSVVLSKESNVVILDPQKDGLYIRPKLTNNQETTSFVTTEKMEGESFKIAFNYRFLAEFLSISKEKLIVFESAGPTSPCVFKIEGDDSFLHIIMPLRTEETA